MLIFAAVPSEVDFHTGGRDSTVLIVIESIEGFVGQGSGVMLTPDFIGTARHVVASGRCETCRMMAMGANGTVRVVEEWVHPTADIGVLKIVGDRQEMMMKKPIFIATPNTYNRKATLTGFLGDVGLTSTEGKLCFGHAGFKMYICQEHMPVIIKANSVPPSDISFDDGLAAAKRYVEALQTDPSARFEDVVYTKHIVADLAPQGMLRDSGGMSGGPLLDAHGRVFAIFFARNYGNGKFVFIPLHEIPEQYW